MVVELTAPVTPGDVVDGKYCIERVLGRGGMGVVVAAQHVQLRQRVALKFTNRSAVDDDVTMERFVTEARTAFKLKSPHTARVTDVGSLPTGDLYMVLELLEGCDLEELVTKEGALPISTAVDYILQACESLAEAHALGIVHRDLKPKNLFLTTDVSGSALVKVLDFGVAKLLRRAKEITSSLDVLGSPQYMSPEQLGGASNVDGRSDVWSIGVCLYELVSGRPPFLGETLAEIWASVLNDPPPSLRELRPDVPAALAAAILSCLEKERDARMPSVVDLARELEPFGSTPGMARRIANVSERTLRRAPTTPPPPPRLRAGAPPSPMAFPTAATADPPSPVEADTLASPMATDGVRPRKWLVVPALLAVASTVLVVLFARSPGGAPALRAALAAPAESATSVDVITPSSDPLEPPPAAVAPLAPPDVRPRRLPVAAPRPTHPAARKDDSPRKPMASL